MITSASASGREAVPSMVASHPGGPVADTPGMLQGPQQTWEGGSARGKWVVLFQIPWLLILFPFFWIVVTFLWTFKCILGNIFFQGIRSFSSFRYFFSAQTVYIFWGGYRILILCECSFNVFKMVLWWCLPYLCLDIPYKPYSCLFGLCLLQYLLHSL